MQQNKVKEFIIHGSVDYTCQIDDRRVIIERSPVPPKNDFLWGGLDEVFAKYRGQVEFELVGDKEYPLTPQDKYNLMKVKNPAIMRLKKKFNMEVY